ncbi:TrwC-domain-containing protein [Piedraia hortae CBS 480.64]|uniref:TrwC-domain-containing protein n=1 Tax=Piedraia hortae CBS 480.64 TaxID=1314780 RepID=A0A6A7BNW9_9PEZI|nr:TrwC-domain-containing protein [Piedraia hortae CBS 480.64]
MHRLERDDQLALTRARTEFIKGMPERITASFNPIRAEMRLLAERIDRHPRLDAIDERQRDHTEALRENTAAIRSLEQQPRTKVSYTVWDRDWSGRKVGAALSVVWLLCVGSYFFAAMALPPSWFAVRSANYLLGGGDQAVCALDYRPGKARHPAGQTMISVAAVGSASDAAAYYARDNYYTADQAKGASAWAGEGAAELGLSGPVDAERFEQVLSGKLPDGTVLDAKRGEHRAGWDVTMSVPKSVSVLALVGGDARLVTAVREAAAATLAWTERNIAEARVWNGRGQVPEVTGRFVAATFLHDVNRSGEPQLHVHNVIANATRTADGKWRALHADQLYERQHVMDAVFLSVLRSRVETLGFATIPRHDGRNGAFEIAGVSRAVVEAFSGRSAQIDAYIKDRGLDNTPQAREIAALATRDPKTPELAPEQRAEGWRALAAEKRLDPAPMVKDALAEAARGETVWTRAMRGVRGVGERGLAIAGRMGLTPRDGDPLVPERLGRLSPTAFAAAQAVASAVRDLGEREAAFDRLELIRESLTRGGPVTVADVEARLALLQEKGLLLGDGDRMVTTRGAVQLEQAYLAAVEAGQGRSAAIVPPGTAAVRAQEAARELNLHRLNPGQEAAAVLMLSSSDRVVNVQGGSGRGKSTAMAPVTAVARAEGRAVIGLAVASVKASEFGRDTGADVSTVARFLARHERLIDGTARPEQLARVKAELAGAIIMVEEAGQVGTRDMARIVRLANITGAARVVQTGDTRQLTAIAAGKPFEASRRAGVATAHITENLRSRSDQMKAVTAALDRGDVSGTFDVLRSATTEVPGNEVATTVAARWAALPKDERDATLLLTAGRAMRSEANRAVQAELKARGEIAATGTPFTVLDRVNATREGARLMRAYRPGHVVEVRTNLPAQGLVRGDRGIVTAVEGDRVRLGMADGAEKLFRPGRLAKNLDRDAVSIFALKQVELHAGDRIRWSDNDRARGLDNGAMARVKEVGRGRLVVSSLVDGTVHEIGPGDRMAERLDLAYAINVHVAQGVTTEHGIVAMRSSERKLLTERSFLVALTRVADKVALVLDDARRVERSVTRNTGDKTSALDVVERGQAPDIIRLPDAGSPLDQALERYAQLFLAAERMREDGRELSSSEMRELDAASAALDRVRPYAAEDLRIVLDRSPDPVRGLEQVAPGELRQIWAEEGRARADPRTYADRFVSDWQSASGDREAAETSQAEDRAERRLERLEERMLRQPELEKALDARFPELQLRTDGPGMGGGSRDRDQGMEL